MFLIDYLVQSDHDNQIEDPIKKLEWKKKDGDHVHEHEDYEFRLWNGDNDQLMRKRGTSRSMQEKYSNIIYQCFSLL